MAEIPSPKTQVCEVSIFFVDGEHLFKLPLRQIAELEEKCGGYDHGGAIGAIFQRVFSGQYRVNDLIETIRLGLIGGGMSQLDAKTMVDRNCVPPVMALETIWQFALAILGTCAKGYEPPEVPVKKKRASRKRATAGST